MRDINTKWLPVAAVAATLWASGMTGAQAAVCTAVNSYTNPDAQVTDSVACGDGTLSANDSATEVRTAENASGYNLNWLDFVTKVDSGGGSTTSSGSSSLGTLSFTTNAAQTSGTWSLTTSLSLAANDFLLVLKDGSVDQAAPRWFWFILAEPSSSFTCATGVTLCGTWSMYGENGNIKQISHISAYYATSRPPQEIPEPGPLGLLGLGMVGLWYARRRVRS